jgi:tetratricopeptide (TPR) repeat protein
LPYVAFAVRIGLQNRIYQSNVSDFALNDKRTITGKMNFKRPSRRTYNVAQIQAAQTKAAGKKSAEKNAAQKIRAGEFTGVIPGLMRAVADNPDDIPAWRNLARAYNEKRDFKNGLKAAEQLVRLQPGSIPAQVGLAMILSNMRDFDRSLPLLQELYDEEPENLVILDCLKVGHHNQGNREKAVKFGDDALRLRDQYAREFATKRKFPPIEHTFWKQEERTRKIISYSLYGEKRVYHHGAIINARLSKYIFPDWSCRFYLGDDVPQGVVAELQQSGAEVVFAGHEHSEVPKAFWRFLVADDPKVKFFMIRDCDARPTTKDALAIAAWLDRGRPFHVLRDHVLHNMPMMGGMWGGRTDYTWDMAARIAVYCRNGVNNIYGADQDFLMNHIWPLIRDKTLVYDSYYNLMGSSSFPYFGKGTDADHLGMGVVGNKLLRAEAMDFGLPWPDGGVKSGK